MLNKKLNTVEAARNKWAGILFELGIPLEFLRNKHGPCPCCGGVDRYRFDDKDGTGSFFCSHCGSGNGIDLLMRVNGWEFKKAASEVDRVVLNVPIQINKNERSEKEKIDAIKKVLSGCKKVEKGDPVWLYLNRRTGIKIIPNDIRYHHNLWYEQGKSYPAMVSIMRDKNGNGISLHRTYLSLSGEKANVDMPKKFMQGKPLNGASVRTSNAFEKIGIAEGIETALAASVKFALPVWAATNAGLLESWSAPERVDEVIIFGDNDGNFVGQVAAYKLANKLSISGLKVEVKIPKKTNTDWAD